MSKLAQACELSFNDWLATFPDVIPEAERSKKHEKWKKKLFDKMRNDRYHVFTTKTVKVMLVAAVLTALLMTAFVIPSSREYILDNFDEFSRYKITENNQNSVNGEITVGYIPEKFELKEQNKFDKQIVNIYATKENDCFTIYKSSSSIEVDIDSEKFDSEEFLIDGIKFVYCEGGMGVNNIIWIKNDYIYRIDGTLIKDELLKIAKTVE